MANYFSCIFILFGRIAPDKQPLVAPACAPSGLFWVVCFCGFVVFSSWCGECCPPVVFRLVKIAVRTALNVISPWSPHAPETLLSTTSPGAFRLGRPGTNRPAPCRFFSSFPPASFLSDRSADGCRRLFTARPVPCLAVLHPISIPSSGVFSFASLPPESTATGCQPPPPRVPQIPFTWLIYLLIIPPVATGHRHNA